MLSLLGPLILLGSHNSYPVFIHNYVKDQSLSKYLMSSYYILVTRDMKILRHGLYSQEGHSLKRDEQ